MRKDMKTFPVKKVKVLQNVSVVIVYAFLYQYLYVRLFKRLIKSDGFSRIAFAVKGQRRLVVNAAVSPAVWNNYPPERLKVLFAQRTRDNACSLVILYVY